MATLEIYLANDGWRWRLKAANGRVVADSGEPYADRSNCRRAAKRMRALAAEADLRDA